MSATLTKLPTDLGYWLDEWEASRQGHVSGARQRADHTRIRTYLLPILTARDVTRLGAPKIERWLETLREEGVGEATIHATLMCLRQSLDLAESRGVILANPAKGISARSNVVNEPEEQQIIDESGLERLIAEIDPHYKAMVLLAARTGARWDECLGVQLSDLYLDDATAMIGSRRVVERQRGYEIVEGDSRERRIVPLTDDAVQALREHIAENMDPGQEFLFLTPRSRSHPARTNFNVWVWRPALERAGLGSRSHTFHDLRHTAAINFIRAKYPAEKVARFLGHKSDQVTRRLYKQYFAEAAGEEQE